ncbi:FHA domain-containing protein [Phormidium tenue FACHB-886]|nr:FHA domain-containing protein [Phormidium tenue FACHB-886]
MLKIKVFNYQTGEFQETVLEPEAQPEKECSIGRAKDCNLVLESSDISRVHAKIQIQQNVYYFIDPGSANGSFINGQPAEKKQKYTLKEEDLIRIGDFVLLVEMIGASSANGKTSNILQQVQTSYSRRLSQPEWTGDLTVRCVRITPETSDVKTFTFVADPPVLFTYKPGQFVTLDLEINGESVLRSYSISSTPSRPHSLEVTVKRVPAPVDTPHASPGLVSNWLHDTIVVGSQVKISAPMGKFTCAPHPAAKLLLISAGSGITPMMSMSRWIADTATAADVAFFHCARTPNDVIFRQELELMSARLPNFHLAIATTQTAIGQPWAGFTGRLTEAMLRCIAPDFQDRHIYVCGPAGFMQATKSLMEGLGFPMQHYAEESFGSPKAKSPKPAKAATVPNPVPAAPNKSASKSAPASSPVVLFSKSGKEVAAEGSESILELAEQEGVKIRSNCRQGVCGACKKRKLEGEVRYDCEPDALEPDDRAAGYILTCAAVPVGRVVVEA